MFKKKKVLESLGEEGGQIRMVKKEKIGEIFFGNRLQKADNLAPALNEDRSLFRKGPEDLIGVVLQLGGIDRSHKIATFMAINNKAILSPSSTKIVGF